MSLESDPHFESTASDPRPNSDSRPNSDPRPNHVGEAVADYRALPSTIDNDTRLASAGDTESIWPGRPARRSVIRSLQRTVAGAACPDEISAYRGDGATSHTRRDLLTGAWTIFAPKRDQRPNEFASAQSAAAAEALERLVALDSKTVDSACPFCVGSESRTPEAVWSARLGDLSWADLDHATTRFARPRVEVVEGEQENWDVRVVPNKFPAVSPGDATDVAPLEQRSWFPISNVVGGHEVIIESGFHTESVTQFDPSLVYVTLMAYRDRIRHWSEIPGINYISVFKNCGSEAGASLRHSHSQLVATSMMPHHVRSSLLRCEHHRARTGCSLGCDLLRAELEEKTRVIDRTDEMVAFCPFASRFAGLVRITSVAHQPHFEVFNDASLDQLASFLFRVLYWVNQAFPGKAFNYLLNTCPPGSQQPESFQWSLDVFPRLNKTAGFEWSSDCMINSLLPEFAASRYREIARRNDPRNVLAVR